MSRGCGILSPGSGGTSIAYEARAAEEICGIRVTSKICELCGRMFFREGTEKDCKPCAAKLAKPAEPIPGIAESDLKRANWQQHYEKISAANRETTRKRMQELRRRQAMPQPKIHLQRRWDEGSTESMI